MKPTLQLNNSVEVLEKVYNSLNLYSKRYGFYSLAALIIKHNILSISLDIKVNSSYNKKLSINEVEKAQNLVQDHYDSTEERHKMENQKSYIEKLFIDNEMVYKYNTQRYRDKYYEYARQVKHKVNVLNEKLTSIINEREFYIYAINKNNEPIIFTENVPFRELILGRGKDNLNVHPILVEKYDLMAKCAGEVMFIKDKYNDIKGAIINNKSGHFRPEHESLDIAIKVFAITLKIPLEDIIKISVGGNNKSVRKKI